MVASLVQTWPPSPAAASVRPPASGVVWVVAAGSATGPRAWADLPHVPPLLHAALELLYTGRLLHSDVSHNVDTLLVSGLPSSYSHKTHYSDAFHPVDTNI